MESNIEEVPHKQRGKTPLFYVAVGAIFLLAVVSLGFRAFSDSPQINPESLLVASSSSLNSGSASAQISSNQLAVAEAPELIFLNATGIIAVSPPLTVTPKILGAILGASDADFTSKSEVLRYIVEEGDTLATLAEKFAISLNTIVWANDLNSTSSLTPGEELIILPVSGALHLVRPNDTLSEIALWYQADARDIVEFNQLSSSEDVFVGDLLLIPNGIMPAVLPQGRLTAIANSYFIYPVSRSYGITQGLHAFNAVDLGNGKCWGPVYAAAGGNVQRAGYHGVGGNYVRILHPNGVVTYYGHLASSTVTAGQKVLQGQIIGYVGHSGYTIPASAAGCHLHFEVRGAANPFR